MLKQLALDPVLQPPASSPGAGHEDTRRGVCFSSLTCAKSAGSIHKGAAKSLTRSGVHGVALHSGNRPAHFTE